MRSCRDDGATTAPLHCPPVAGNSTGFCGPRKRVALALPPLRTERAPNPQRVVQGATLLAGVSLVLVIVNIVLASLNQTMQENVNRRQQVLVQAAQLSSVATILQRAMVTQAEQGDEKIQAVLKRADITFKAPASASSPTPAAPASKP